MKIINYLLFIGFMVMPVYAQSVENSEESNATETSAQRPSMPDLFFRKEQRRVLEVVREGIVVEDDFDIEEFVPVVIIEEQLEPEEEELIRARARGADIYFDSYIVNRSNGKSILWINGKALRVDEDRDVLSRQGIELAQGEEGSSIALENGVLKGRDAYSNSKFRVNVGQIIGVDGSVDETLPIIVKK